MRGQNIDGKITDVEAPRASLEQQPHISLEAVVGTLRGPKNCDGDPKPGFRDSSLRKPMPNEVPNTPRVDLFLGCC